MDARLVHDPYSLVPHPQQHTMTALLQFVNDPPPRVPEPVTRALVAAYQQFRTHPPASAQEVEHALIAFGRLLWPYRKAFEALIRTELAANDHALFTKRLTSTMREHFAAFKATGRSLADLHDAGTVGSFFPAGEWGALCTLLLDARRDAQVHVREQVDAQPAAYDRLVREYQAILHEIDEHLAALRRLAERVGEDTEVREHIVEALRGFDLGFVHLAEAPTASEVCAAVETYRDRGERERVRRKVHGARIF
ncbi:MAG: hypothetical protein Q7S96_01365 [bacterium]|nr:hypothetical protein [bacterium]